jgi:hypothetical protein
MNMQEQRLSHRLRGYWDNIAKGQELPVLQSFSPAAVDDLWPFCLRVVVINGEQHLFKCDYMGKELTTLYGSDLNGEMIDERGAKFSGMTIHRKLIEVLRTRKPLLHEGQFVTPKGQMLRYRGCFLPFGNQDGVTHVIMGLSYRFY